MIKVKKTFILIVQADWDCGMYICGLLDNCGVNAVRNSGLTPGVDLLMDDIRYCDFVVEYNCAIESSNFEGFLDYLDGCLDESVDVTVLM